MHFCIPADRRLQPTVQRVIPNIQLHRQRRVARRDKVTRAIGFVPVVSDRIESQPLFEEDFVLIASPRHRFARRRYLSLSALAKESLILLPHMFCTRRLLEASFEQAGVQPKIIVEMNSIEGILATVRRSNLATVLPRLSLGLARHRTLRAIALKNPTPRRGIGLLWKKGGHRSGAAKALTDQVRAVVAEHWRS